MRYVEVRGFRVSVVGLGTWQFGAEPWGYGPDYVGHVAEEIVRAAVDLGVNFVDTAEVYGHGQAERIVGRALAARAGRARVATKLYPDLPVAPVVVVKGRASRRRLDIARIDLYQVHGRNPAVPLGSTMRGMQRLVAEGVVERVGVSNFWLSEWQEADRALGGPVLSNQIEYSLVHRGAERDVLPWAREQDRLVIAYSPLAQGLLSGRYDLGARPSGHRRLSPVFEAPYVDLARPLIEALRRVGAVHDATPSQVALAWVLRQPNVVVITGASSVEQVHENAAAADLELSTDEEAELDELSRRCPRPAGTTSRLGALRMAWRRRQAVRPA